MVEINSTNKQIKVNVSSAGSGTSIGLSTPQTYYDNLAKQWAISESIVNNEDFSSKHYAEESKSNSEASNNVLNAVLTEHEQITAEITSGRTNIASDITAGVETLQTEGSTQKEAVKAEGNAQVARVQAEGANYATKAEATYTAGAGIAIENNVISNTQSSAEWGNIEGEIGNQTDLVEYISSSLNNPYSLFDNKYTEAPLYNVSWLNASAGTFYPKASYPKAYEALVVEQNSSVTAGTTVTLPSGTKYTKRGLSVKLSTDESATDYDFKINTTDETFRLPLKNGQEGMFTNTTVPEGYNLYYYVGETVQNANLIDAGRIGEQLATKASVDDIDGAFVKDVLVLVDGTNYTVGTTHDTKTLVQFDISNYLPEDSNEYDYEVRLSSEGYTITDNSVMLWIDIPSVADMSHNWSDQQTTSCGSVGSVVTQIIPKGYKKISIYLRSSSSAMLFYSHTVGYRRLRKGV